MCDIVRSPNIVFICMCMFDSSMHVWANSVSLFLPLPLPLLVMGNIFLLVCYLLVGTVEVADGSRREDCEQICYEFAERAIF